MLCDKLLMNTKNNWDLKSLRDKASNILNRSQLKKEVAKISLNINVYAYANKTEIISLNHNAPVNIELENCSTEINNVTNFEYMGAWMKDSQNDFEIRKAQACYAIHKMKLIWNSKMRNHLKNKNLQSDY